MDGSARIMIHRTMRRLPSVLTLVTAWGDTNNAATFNCAHRAP